MTTTIKAQIEAWKKASTDGSQFVLVDVNEKERTVLFTLDGKLMKVTVPADKESVWEVDTEEATLTELNTNLTSFVLDRPGLEIKAFFDKCLVFYSKLKAPKKKKEEDEDDWGVEEAEGKDDKGWGDFEEEGQEAQPLPDSDDYNKWQAIKKKWEKKEEALRKKAAAVDESKKKTQIFSSKAASKMVSNGLLELMKNGSKLGIEAEAVDDNPFHWRLRMSNFAPESQLYKDAMKLKSKYGYAHVELEFKFLMDLYPFYPPSVRLVRPRLKNFMMGRIVCMEELQLAKWNPVREISDILASIRRLLEKWGQIEDEGNVNDPKNDMPPYTALEFQLLRLSMLTEIAPRIVKTLADTEAKQLIVPKQKIVEKKEFVKANTHTDHYYRGSSTGGKAWASGTGYGHGSQTDWDVEGFLAAQKKKEAEIQEICEEMLHELQADKVPAGLGEVLAQSCMLPFLDQYLENDSVTDMERHLELYHTVFAILSAMTKHRTIAKLFLPQPGETKSLQATILDREKQALIVEKFSGDGDDNSSSSSSSSNKKDKDKNQQMSLSARILEVATLMRKALKEIADEEAKNSSKTEGKKEKESKETDEKKSYCDLMAGFKFDELNNFRAQHYWSKHLSEAEGVTRAYTRRLATEYSDLSKSLPINYDSSVFMRVHESKMSFAQVLILAPDNTPYGRGAFLFDIFFPSTYPNTPPLVNLQTTGSGSVRFNPNLYNCGKVCLSLLGTWRGQAGESWNPKTSTFLQVAVSIQSLIFVPEPYFNEPGYERDMGTPTGRQRSDEYNRNIQIQTIKFAMIDQMKNPPPGFEKIIQAHFALQKNIIMQQCEEWAKTNSGVKSLLSELKGLLDKQKVPAPEKDK